MARDPGIRYIHVFYEGEPAEDGSLRPHDLESGNECDCEPKCVRISRDTILVIHDPEDGLLVVEDKNDKRRIPPPPDSFGGGTPY